MGYKIAVVGATGNVGREIMNVLTERRFPADEVHALNAARIAGKDDADIRKLVLLLHAARTAGAAA